MPKALGIGGFFIRSSDPKALSEWYELHFGINKVPLDYETPVWQQEAGPTVFATYGPDAEDLGRKSQQWMLNLRVADLDEAVRELRDAGIEVTMDAEDYPNGRFAQLEDPEGNPIEIWQPANE
ncbi:Glyoxalase family protein [Candidatus Rhodobacter oscarellae]|uniref:Glyoxalase family protein n=1 Tax=Candidatus Rhodobacter oscarellae TaxID=1675527 RepID=A0A0J9EC17_9RHOB|nr:VOC family protein [Candidatus Rhodobacter lobularis]KMW60317.1 Glyoxalase family protein [Candidatus Rhodobacter lobularis]